LTLEKQNAYNGITMSDEPGGESGAPRRNEAWEKGEAKGRVSRFRQRMAENRGAVRTTQAAEQLQEMRRKGDVSEAAEQERGRVARAGQEADQAETDRRTAQAEGQMRAGAAETRAFVEEQREDLRRTIAEDRTNLEEEGLRRTRSVREAAEAAGLGDVALNELADRLDSMLPAARRVAAARDEMADLGIDITTGRPQKPGLLDRAKGMIGMGVASQGEQRSAERAAQKIERQQLDRAAAAGEEALRQRDEEEGVDNNIAEAEIINEDSPED
jgi:hypothetical protein